MVTGTIEELREKEAFREKRQWERLQKQYPKMNVDLKYDAGVWITSYRDPKTGDLLATKTETDPRYQYGPKVHTDPATGERFIYTGEGAPRFPRIPQPPTERIRITEKQAEKLTLEQRAREAVEAGAVSAGVAGAGGLVSTIGPRAAAGVGLAGVGLAGTYVGIAGVGALHELGITKRLEEVGRDMERCLGATGDILRVAFAPTYARRKPIGEAIDAEGKALINTFKTRSELLIAAGIGGYFGFKGGVRLGNTLKGINVKMADSLAGEFRKMADSRAAYPRDFGGVSKYESLTDLAKRPGRIEVLLRSSEKRLMSYTSLRKELEVPYVGWAKVHQRAVQIQKQLQKVQPDLDFATRQWVQEPFTATARIRSIIHPKVTDVGAAAGLLALRKTEQAVKQMTKQGTKTMTRQKTLEKQLIKSLNKTAQIHKTITDTRTRTQLLTGTGILQKMAQQTKTVEKIITKDVKIPAPKIPAALITPRTRPGLFGFPRRGPKKRPKRRVKMKKKRRKRRGYAPSIAGLTLPRIGKIPKIVTGLEHRPRARRKKKKKRKAKRRRR